MSYGTPKPVLKGDSTDSDGIRHLKLSQLWQPSKSGLSMVEMLAERPEAPSIPGYSLVLPIETESRNGCFETTWTFDGASWSSDSKNRSNSTDWSFEPIWQEKSLLTHPHLANLLDIYRGTVNKDAGNIDWKDTVSPGKSRYVSGLAGSSSSTIQNPIRAQQNYFDLTGGIYSFRYAQTSRPGGLYSHIGEIWTTSELPGRPPVFTDRNWLKIQPKESCVGENMFKFEEIYWLSGKGGWNEDIYDGSL